MKFQQVLKQEGSYSGAQIGISVSSPSPGKAPHFFGLLLDMFLNAHDCLPPWIGLAIRRHFPRKDSLCLSYGLEYGHAFSSTSD
jgi:hypothetical protein